MRLEILVKKSSKKKIGRIFRYEIHEIETGRTFVWTISEILEEINRDRSEEWVDYDESDWLEGWDEWCEGEYFKLGRIIIV